MANSEFKTAAAQLLDQNGVKESPAAATLQAEPQNAPKQAPAANVAAAKPATPTVTRIPLTFPLVVALAKKRLSLGLAVACAVGMLAVPELLIPKSFKIFNVILGLVMGLTYGVILTYPQAGEEATGEHGK
jgi:uncharacterized membrane protein